MDRFEELVNLVTSRDALIQMKLSAGRTQDVADIEALRELDR